MSIMERFHVHSYKRFERNVIYECVRAFLSQEIFRFDLVCFRIELFCFQKLSESLSHFDANKLLLVLFIVVYVEF